MAVVALGGGGVSTTGGSWSSPTLPALPRIYVPSDDLRWLREASLFYATKFIRHGGKHSTSPHDRLEFKDDPPYDPIVHPIRFLLRAKVSPTVVLLGYYYLFKLIRRVKGVRITGQNATRMMSVAFMTAAKFIDDQSMRYTNRHWVRIFGKCWTIDKLNQMEREFLNAIGYDLTVNMSEFFEFCCFANVDLRTIAVK